MFREVRMKEADCNINLGFLGGGCIGNLGVKKWRMWLKKSKGSHSYARFWKRS